MEASGKWESCHCGPHPRETETAESGATQLPLFSQCRVDTIVRTHHSLEVRVIRCVCWTLKVQLVEGKLVCCHLSVYGTIFFG